MTTRDRNNAIHVRFTTFKNNEEVVIGSYYTTAMEQTLSMFITAKENEVECWFNEYSEVIPEEYKTTAHFIADVTLTLGSKEDIPTIEVVLE